MSTTRRDIDGTDDGSTHRSSSTVPGSPTVKPAYLWGRPADSAWRRLTAGAEWWLPYGSGKAALRDGLDAVGCGPESNVILPAYIPRGVLQPIRELGAEPRLHGIQRDLTPTIEDIEEAIDEKTAAILVVNYFGFPQSTFDAIHEIASDWGAVVIDDNAHAPLSREGSQLLGTRGSVGFTSLRKGFPVPDGAFLYLDAEVASAIEPSTYARIRSTPTLRDSIDVLSSLLRRNDLTAPLPERALRVRQSGPTGQTNGQSSGWKTARNTYEQAKQPMSALSAHVVKRIPAEKIVDARRRVYRAWLDGITDMEPVFGDLPNAVCPQYCPMLASDPASAVTALDAAGVGGVHTWPPLPTEVRTDDEFATSRWLADHLLTLPVHRDIPIAAVSDAIDSLDRLT